MNNRLKIFLSRTIGSRLNLLTDFVSPSTKDTVENVIRHGTETFIGKERATALTPELQEPLILKRFIERYRQKCPAREQILRLRDAFPFRSN